jgi:putative glutathione S-transferase
MGRLINGKWQTDAQLRELKEADTASGTFEREDSYFRDGWIALDGDDSVPAGKQPFPADLSRYHLYVAWACPWAHRTLIYREMLSLHDIGVSVVNPLMLENGWTFESGEGVVADPNLSADYLYQIYQAADESYSGRVTVPVLWDKVRGTIVNNESAEIIRMLNGAFASEGKDYYPAALRDDIDRINERVYETVNNGVYKAGFATTQSAYDEAVEALFETLSWLEVRLARERFLLGDTITEADWRLFPTLVRFDSVYAVHFKCCRKRVIDHPNLWAYTRDLYQQPGIADTINLELTKAHYYRSHRSINPCGLVASTAPMEFDAPHHRAGWNEEPPPSTPLTRMSSLTTVK